jgi:hypothetical protein
MQVSSILRTICYKSRSKNPEYSKDIAKERYRTTIPGPSASQGHLLQPCSQPSEIQYFIRIRPKAHSARPRGQLNNGIPQDYERPLTIDQSWFLEVIFAAIGRNSLNFPACARSARTESGAVPVRLTTSFLRYTQLPQ